MANDIAASFAQRWSKSMQLKHFKTDVFREIASFREEEMLSKGQTVSRPYRSKMTTNTMGSEGQYTRQDITDTDETLTVNTERDSSFYIKDLDKLRSEYDTTNLYAGDAAAALSNVIDGAVLAEVVNAGGTVDDADFGGTLGNGVTLSDSNVFDVFLAAEEKLDRKNAPNDGRFAALSPQFCRVLKSALIKRESAWGDKIGENGYLGMYNNFSIYKSNGVYSSYSLALATNPTDGDTLTINLPDNQGDRRTITLTFRATLGVLAGSVHIASTVDITRANLVEFLNSPSTSEAEDTDTGYVALSSEDQAVLKEVTFTNDNTANTMAMAVEGKGFAVVGETLTNATDTWTAATQLQRNMFGVKGCTSLVIQVKPNMKIKPRDGYIGDDIVSWQVFGKKTFADDARRMVSVNIRADQFLAA